MRVEDAQELLQSYEAIQRRAVPDTPLMHFLHLLIQASCCCQPRLTWLGALYLLLSIQSVPASVSCLCQVQQLHLAGLIIYLHAMQSEPA